MKSEEKLPLISVIVPIYNTEKYLNECLGSISEQTYKNLEIILVNDGSTDNSPKIVEDFVKNDSRARALFQKNSGQALARQNGFVESKGEYICFVDADDIISKTYVEDLFAALKQEKTDMSVCGIAVFCKRSDIEKIRKKDKNETSLEKNLLKIFSENYRLLSPPHFILQSMTTKLYRRDLLEDLDYSVLKTNVLEDNLISSQIIKKVKDDCIAVVKKSLYFYRANEESTMSSVMNGMIKYDDEELLYPEVFHKTMEYLREYFHGRPGVDRYINKIQLDEFYSIANAAVSKNINQNKEIIRKNQIIREKDRLISDIVNSRSYKIGLRIGSLVRLFKKLRFRKILMK